MKIQSTIFLILFAILIACEEEEKTITDPVYEFIAFQDAGPVNVNEAGNSTEAVPAVVQMLVYEPYSEDVTIQYTVAGNNTAEGVDFTVTPANSITLKAGKLVSDTIWIKTIDNEAGTPDARTFTLSITSVSNSDLKVGLGLTEQRQKTLTFNIVDDECSETIDIYSAEMDNTIFLEGVEQAQPNAATGELIGNKLKLTGDLFWYAALNALEVTLEPEFEGATKGTATFGEQFMGADPWGYEYSFTQVGTGSYDVCSGTITLEYEVYYRLVGDTDWTYWSDHDTKNIYQLR